MRESRYPGLQQSGGFQSHAKRDLAVVDTTPEWVLLQHLCVNLSTQAHVMDYLQLGNRKWIRQEKRPDINSRFTTLNSKLEKLGLAYPV